jgi:plastocyanin
VEHRGTRLVLTLLAGLAAVLLLSACSGDSDAATDDGGVVGIGMLDNVYTRDVTRVPVGGSVRFSNDGDTIHNAFAADGSWSTEEATGEAAMQPGDRTTMTFDDPGVYTFYCTFHATQDEDGEWQGMVATLVVGDVEYSSAGEGEAAEPVEEWTRTTRDVPADYPTIQNAVDAAEPGDLVLVDEGVYREQVDVTTPYITIRGVDRQGVVVDGEFTRPNGINVAAADGVAVENLTVRNATVNGLFFTGLTGYRASHVTATNNGVYGIYAFDATDGLFEHSYASGSPDAGFYIGQCDPCDAVIRDVVSEWNGLGYSGTNASGPLYILDSVWRHNIGGIVPNTLDTELLPPVERVTIAGNLVHDNDNPEAPALSGAWGSFGAGITIAGGNDVVVANNRVVNHDRTGIFVTPNSSRRFWMSADNEVRDNVVAGSGLADLTLSGVNQTGNCFSGNDVRTTVPPALQTLQGCSGLRLPMQFDLGQLGTSLGLVAESSDAAAARADAWRTAPAPAADEQPDLPGGADAPVVPAYRVVDGLDIDIDQITTPGLPDGLDVTQSKVLTMAGIPVFASAFGTFYGLYAYLLPFALYAAWIGLAAWDLSRRDDLSRAAQVGWMAVVLLVPFLGPVIYYLVGRSRIPAHMRWTLVAGGFLAYAVTFAVGAVVGGVV